MKVAGIPYVQGRNSYSDADGTKFGIAIHNTSNTATAANEASYATRRPDGVSAHLYADDKQVIQSLDTSARAGHAGSSNGNQHAVAVEITGVNSWTRQQWLDRVAWDKLGAVLAQVCRHYGIAVRRASVAEMRANPKVRAFYSHDDMRRAWGGTDHTDPGASFPWDRLFAAVNAALGTTPPAATTGDDDMSWGTDTLTQGNPGYAGHQHDTALAFAWQAANEAKTNTDKLLAEAAGDKARDEATLLAIKALAVGGPVEAAPLIAAINSVGDKVTAQVAELQARVAELEEELAATRAAAEANLSPAEKASLDGDPDN